jgi:cytochrome c biogenesis protein CcdA
MSSLIVAVVSALWLGILTSISPCPLATNIAAISFIGRRVDKAKWVFLAGVFYTLGRMLTYMVLGALIVASILSIPHLSHFLEKYMNKLLGPILIMVGMIILEMIQLNIFGSGVGERVQKKAESWGIWGAGLLGILFALSFCPVSAALFFGSLIPLSISSNSNVLLPAVYGLGTGLPVFVFALLIALGAQWVGKAYQKISQVEVWMRRITGGVFIVVGIYLSLVYIFGIL